MPSVVQTMESNHPPEHVRTVPTSPTAGDNAVMIPSTVTTETPNNPSTWDRQKKIPLSNLRAGERLTLYWWEHVPSLLKEEPSLQVDCTEDGYNYTFVKGPEKLLNFKPTSLNDAGVAIRKFMDKPSQHEQEQTVVRGIVYHRRQKDRQLYQLGTVRIGSKIETIATNSQPAEHTPSPLWRSARRAVCNTVHSRTAFAHALGPEDVRTREITLHLAGRSIVHAFPQLVHLLLREVPNHPLPLGHKEVAVYNRALADEVRLRGLLNGQIGASQLRHCVLDAFSIVPRYVRCSCRRRCSPVRKLPPHPRRTRRNCDG